MEKERVWGKGLNVPETSSFYNGFLHRHKLVKKRDKRYGSCNRVFLIGFVICFVLMLTGVSIVGATDHYVATWGNDSNSGTSLVSPWQHPSYAAQQAQAGDTIYLVDGTWSDEYVVFTNSGTEGDPILMRAFNGTPKLDGQDGTGYGIEIDQSYINISDLTIANYSRGINIDGGNNMNISGCAFSNNTYGIYIDGSSSTLITNNDIQGNLLLSETEDFESGMGSWMEDDNPVYPATYNITTTADEAHTGFASCQLEAVGINNMFQFWINRRFTISPTTDYRVCLAGWHKVTKTYIYTLDDNMLSSARSRLQTSPITEITWAPSQGYYAGYITGWYRGYTSAELTSSDATFNAGVGYWVSNPDTPSSWTFPGYIDDLEVIAYGNNTNDGVYIKNSDNITITSNTIKYYYNDGIFLDESTYISITGGTIEYCGDDGIDARASGTTAITTTSIFGIEDEGIYSDQDNVNVTNSYINQTIDKGINLDGDYVTVDNNYLFNNGGTTVVSGIDVEEYSTVTNNTVCFGLTDIRAEYYSTISDNLLYFPSSMGINLEYRKWQMNLTNNTIGGAASMGIRLKQTYDSDIKNNIIRNCSAGIVLQQYHGITSESLTIDNNTITGGTIAIDAEDIVEDTFTNNRVDKQIVIEGQTNEWSSWRYDNTNAGSTGYKLLPVPWGAVGGFLTAYPTYETAGMEILYSKSLGVEIKSTPAIVNHVLYVLANGTLYAFSETNGEELWNYATSNPNPSTITGVGSVYLHSSPTVDSGVVYFASNDTVYATYANNGTEFWNHNVGDYVVSSPLIYNDVVIFGCTNNKVYGLYAVNGTQKWSYDAGDPIVASPCISNAKIIITDWDADLIAINEDGTEAWTAEVTESGNWSSPFIDSDGYIYFGTDQNATGYSTLYSYFENGTERWSKTEIDGSIIATPCMGYYIDVVTSNGSVYLVSKDDGSLYAPAKITYHGKCIASPIYLYNAYFIVDYTGRVWREYSWYASYVAYRWNTTFSESISASPAHAYGKVFLATESGNIYVLCAPFNIQIDRNTINSSADGIYAYSTSLKISNNTITNTTNAINFSGVFDYNQELQDNTITLSTYDMLLNDYAYAVDTGRDIQKIYSSDAYSSIAFENNSVRVATSVNQSGQINRTITDNWDQSYIKWDDKGELTATYKITGLKPNTNYKIYDNSFLLDVIIADSSGTLTISGIDLTGEHEIIVQKFTGDVAPITIYDIFPIPTEIGWNNATPVVVTFFRSDNSSGINYTNYSKVLETGPWTTVNISAAMGPDAGNVTAISEDKFNVTVSDEGVTTIWYYSVNNNSVTETVKNVTVKIDTTSPSTISNLQNTTGTIWINWTWTNPTDADFNYTMVYLNGTWQTNTSDPYYNATGLIANTSYGIGTHTVDTNGNVNTTWVNQIAKTEVAPDTIPPASISNLQNSTGTTWINWTWDNPTDADFNYTMVYLDGVFKTNTSDTYYNATELVANTSYEIGTHTVDTYGNVNTTWVNQTAKTEVAPDTTPPASISDLQNTTGTTWINWTWTNPTDADFNYAMVYLNGTWQTNTSDAYYNATGLVANTSYEIGTHTVDTTGNFNTTWVNRTAKTGVALDTIPPASISDLQNITGTTWINWTWTNPTDADFNHTMVYLNGVWQTNTFNPYYNATELTANTSYEIGTHTVDKSGNVNSTWINQTTKTQAVPNSPPTAFIDSITPDPAEQGKDTVSFSGHGTDTDGSVVAYNWSSSIDGLLSTASSSFSKPASELSAGTHTIYFKVQDDVGAWSTEVMEDLTINPEPANQPPFTPANPSPSDGATNISIDALLSWAGGDPDAGDTVTYDVYFGTTTSPALVAENQSGTTYEPGTLNYSTPYYWRIVATDNHGASTGSAVWSFTTGATPNNAPFTPANPSPSNGATNISIDADLSWTGGDPDAGDTVTYDVYFGITTSPALVAENQSGTTYDPGTLNYSTLYYWRIVATDNHGASTGSAVGSFCTGATPNNVPNITITSPENKTYASTCVKLNFTVEPEEVTLVWIGYSLDGNANVTIVGNTTISNDFDTAPYDHNIVVYARRDSYGNENKSSTPVFFTLHPGDVDGNLIVDVEDLEELSNAFFSQPGDDNWNENADLDCDNNIDIDDLEIISRYFFYSY